MAFFVVSLIGFYIQRMSFLLFHSSVLIIIESDIRKTRKTFVMESIYNIIGNKMSVFNLKLQNNMTIFDARLDNGIYFISVKDAKGNVYNSEKIIVIK